MNQVRNFPCNVCKTHFNIIQPSSGTSKWYPTFQPSNKKFVCITLVFKYIRSKIPLGLGSFPNAFENDLKTKLGTCRPQHVRMSQRMELTYGRNLQKSIIIFKGTLREILVSVVLYKSVKGRDVYCHKKGKHKVHLCIFFTLDTPLWYDMTWYDIIRYDIMIYDII
jgi:hypothetical protein